MSKVLDVSALAAEIKSAQDSVRQIEPFTARFHDLDLSTAYEIAQRVHQARLAEGAIPVGRKIGFTNHDMWEKFGVREPIWAYIYDSTVTYLDGTQSSCSLAPFAEPRIEPEIVIQFKSAPKPGDDLQGILGSVGWIAHGFEIVQSHFPGWKFAAADTVADWALHGGLMIGPLQPVNRLGADVAAALKSFSVALSCDGRHVETGVGSNVLGSPLVAIAYLMTTLANQPQYPPLQAGEIVTTGTITTAHSVYPGEIWCSEIEGISLPGLEMTFKD